MHRVITHLGLGRTEASPFNTDPGPVMVELDEPFLGDTELPMDSKEIFSFGDWAVLRLINLEVAVASQLSFYEKHSQAAVWLQIPTPPNETVLIIELGVGNFKSTRPLGPLADNGLWVKPWVDRWGYASLPDLDFSLLDIEAKHRAFLVDRERCAGSVGISASLLLRPTEPKKGYVRHIYAMIAPPQGIIFEKQFAV